MRASRATFGTTVESAEATKELAFNQGFYNLFLAIVTGAGVGFISSGGTPVGAALVFAGVGSMLAAAIVVTGHILYALNDSDSLRSMATGWIPTAWARRHAPRWYEEETGRAAGGRPTGRVGRHT